MMLEGVLEALEAANRRGPFVEMIASKDWQTRRCGLRGFYAAAMPEIEASPINQWALDPYKADWMSIFTPIERALWHDIRSRGAVLYPQFPVGPYFVDFGHPIAKVAIECDGKHHLLQRDEDADRQEDIEARGWSVYRISGSACFDIGRKWIDDEFNERYEQSRADRLIQMVVAKHGIGGR